MSTRTKNPSNWLYNDFDAYEFRCRCGSCIHKDGWFIHRGLVDKLQIIRNLFDKPMVISSGVRCEAHNRASDGAAKSYHLPKMGGRACDILVTDFRDRATIIQEALRIGLTVGLNKRFIHLDNRPGGNGVFPY